MSRHTNASPARSEAGSRDSCGRLGSFESRNGAGEINGVGARAFRRGYSALLGTVAFAIALSFGAGTALAVAPTVSIEAPGTVSYTAANLTGTIDPHGQSTLYAFEYSTDQTNWSGFTYLGPVDETTPGPKEVATELTGLVPGTQYWIRLNAMNFIDPEVVSAEPNPTFTTTVLPAPSVAIDPVTAVTTSTAHFSGTINPEAPSGNPAVADVSWHFECTPECPGLEGSIPADSEDHAISADPTGLKPHTEYKVTLVAGNAAGPVSAGPEQFTTEATAPKAATIPAFALIGGAKAQLGGWVNPENSQTDYWFEFGTDTSYGISVPVTHDADAGTGEAPNFLSQEIPGLQPSTTYHFRIVASNSAGTVNGLDQDFTTSPSEGLGTSIGQSQLPDGRVWEQVSPPDKNNWDIAPAGAVGAAGGGRFSFKSSGGFGDEPTSRGAVLNDYLATRTSTGWVTHGISPQGIIFTSGIGYSGFSEELDKAFLTVYEPQGRSLDPEIEGVNGVQGIAYLRDNLTARYKGFGKGVYVEFAGASADFSHVLLQTGYDLPSSGPCVASEPVPPEQQPFCLFEYANGALRRVSITPEGTPSYGYGLGRRDLNRALTNTEAYGELIHAVSNDGNSIYYGNEGHVYRRTNANTTTDVGKSERTLPPVVGGGTTTFAIAEAAHGDRALLESTAELVDGDDDGSSDMYLYDGGKPAGEGLTLISKGDVPLARAEVETIYMASSDLHRVYFLADNQVLAGQPNSPGPKLYLWEDEGAQSSLRYIATLGIEDLPTVLGSEHVNDNKLAARISSDGRYLTFSTKTRETGYDNAGQKEIYRYDSTTGDVVCISCNPQGRPAVTSATYNDVSEVFFPTHELRNLSSKGQVFFQTYEGLSPHDSNGQQDVYEYENALPRLLSSGVGGASSSFLDASEDGNDVFIDAADRFVGWDYDKNVDAYDARVGGGFPEPPGGSLACEGDSCQPAPVPPNDETPASASFNGAGNLPAPAVPAVKAKLPTRAQKLAKALKACKKDKSKKRRAACVRKAKKRYGRSK